MANQIESYEFYDYRPPISEKFDEVGAEFTISAYNEDIVTQPSQSLLVISGALTVTQNTAATTTTDAKSEKLTEFDTNNYNFVNNGILHIFERIDYFVGDVLIDTIRKPGISTLLKGLPSLEYDSPYNNAGWKLSTNGKSTNILNKKGYFSVTIPLSLIMGYFEDYKNFLYRMPQRLKFYRTTIKPLNALYVKPPTVAGITYDVDISLKDIAWRMPLIKLSIEAETRVRKEILNNTNYDMYYRYWYYQSINPPVGSEYTWDFPTAYSKTKYIILGFQRERENNAGSNMAEFDFLDLENVQVLLNNNVYYPRERLNLKIDELKCGNLYHMFKQFKSSYYGKNPEECQSLIDYDTFLKQYPIIVIDCSRQPIVIKESLINVKILFNWRSNLPSSNVVIHCVMIVDRKAVYNPLNNRVIGF